MPRIHNILLSKSLHPILCVYALSPPSLALPILPRFKRLFRCSDAQAGESEKRQRRFHPCWSRAVAPPALGELAAGTSRLHDLGRALARARLRRPAEIGADDLDCKAHPKRMDDGTTNPVRPSQSLRDKSCYVRMHICRGNLCKYASSLVRHGRPDRA